MRELWSISPRQRKKPERARGREAYDEPVKLAELEQKIGYTFSDKNKLLLAVTHSSYANEHKEEKKKNNERLEFLGDAVLE